jgi:hypothetical protein
VKLLRTILFPALVAFAPAKVFACAACYGGDIDSPMADGMNWGIFTLLAVVGTVLGAFLTFLIYAIRKSEAQAAARQNSRSEERRVGKECT